VDVLLWNYHDADLPAELAKIALEVRGLPQSRMTEEVYLMDASHSNAYAMWQEMGSPQKPNATQQRELVKAGKLERVVAERPLAVRDGAAHLQMMLARQGVTLVRLRWN
jgi:xylan 1,4-beta-xylosidase